MHRFGIFRNHFTGIPPNFPVVDRKEIVKELECIKDKFEMDSLLSAIIEWNLKYLKSDKMTSGYDFSENKYFFKLLYKG